MPSRIAAMAIPAKQRSSHDETRPAFQQRSTPVTKNARK
jgi:hypothetical protein